MARPKIYKVKDFPAPGSIFAMPLADGRIGACRVLRVGMEFREIHALVAASDWVENEAPSISHSAVRNTLWLTHHLHENTPALIWVSKPPPETFIFLGLIKLSKDDKSAECNRFSGWEYLSVQVLAQWRWEHERYSVLQEDEQEKEAQQRKLAQATSDRENYLSKITLPALLSKDLFASWTDYQKPKNKRDIEKIVQAFIRTLSKSKEPFAQEFVAQELTVCVEKLNQLDGERQIIETVEREDLFDVFEEILSAAKHPELLSIVDETRDW